MRGALRLVVAAASLAAAAARAEDIDARRDRPTSVRGGVAAYLGKGVVSPTNGFGELTLSRSVAEPLALELTAGRGFGNVRDTGFQLGGALRLLLWAGSREMHAITGALGVLVATGGAYGTFPYGHVELAYGLRLPAGFDLVAGAGLAAVLADSSTPAVRSCAQPCPAGRAFRAGDAGPWLRLGAGWAF